MNELKIIEQREVLGQDFKIYGDFENPLFLAKDVAEWIGLSNVTDMISRVDNDEVTKFNLGGLQGECNFLTENGLYEVLFQSRKQIAKAFKAEVKKILKEIRTKGTYSRPMSAMEIIAQMAQASLELERKVIAVEEKAEVTQNKLENALDVFTSPLADNWKDETNRKINTLCQINGLPYQVFKGDLYAELQQVANCDITARQRNLKERMKKAGATYKEREAITKIDVIARDEKLKLIFDGIVKKYQAKYA